LASNASWTRPEDTGRSTNCLINEVGIYVHKKERGYHNYASPYSWDVRLGHKTREAALEELDDDIDENNVKQILDEIGYTGDSQYTNTTDSRLTAYYVSEKSLTVSDLRKYLAHELPDYMIPAYYLRLDELPLTPNGKVDRKKLSALGESRPELTENYQAPRTATEKKLAEIWAQVLRKNLTGRQIETGLISSGYYLNVEDRISTEFYEIIINTNPAQAKNL